MRSLLLLLIISPLFGFGQCMLYPVSLEQRVQGAQFIVSGKIIDKSSYQDPVSGSVYTLNRIQVQAWLKNNNSQSEIFLITEGGMVDGHATVVYPSLQVESGKEYVFFLENNNTRIDNKAMRQRSPGILQAKAFADAQGALYNEGNRYTDLMAEPIQSESVLFARIAQLTGEEAKTPAGQKFQARSAETVTQSLNRTMAISGFSPATTNAGTIDPADFITITGSGFGASAGTVEFSNADDGGATFISSGIASDIISWSDASITVKVARRAGNGPIRVNGTMVSPTNLTIDYAHLDINSDFFGFAQSTRQRYYLRNLNSSGGYTFLYNTTFNANTSAVTAFENALETWRCNGSVNFISGGTTAVASVASDGTNAVFFDNTLPSGVLGRATSQFSASATGLCQGTNTVWYLADVDVQFNDPPFTGFTWQYGPALPTGSQFDFESVAVHELGHALGLGHRIAPGDVMHYALSNGLAVRTPSSTEIAGANAKMAYSTVATCFNPAGSGSEMVAASCSTLPVTLFDFYGNKEGKEIVLHWITEHEQNAAYFDLEKSTDGLRFQSIGRVTARGNTQDRINYQFTDNRIFVNNYYRLKMVDRDGEYAFSRTILISDPRTQQNLWILNNPFGQTIEVKLARPVDTPIQFELYSLSGARVYSSRQTGADLITIDLSGITLEKGIYLLRTKIGDELFTNKLLKQ